MTRRAMAWAALWIGNRVGSGLYGPEEAAAIVHFAVDLFGNFNPRFDGPRFRAKVSEYISMRQNAEADV
jgi:hypothetical protein